MPQWDSNAVRPNEARILQWVDDRTTAWCTERDAVVKVTRISYSSANAPNANIESVVGQNAPCQLKPQSISTGFAAPPHGNKAITVAKYILKVAD